jgi:hypothetical protein
MPSNKNEILRCVQILRYFKLKYLLFFLAHRFFRHAGMDVTVRLTGLLPTGLGQPVYDYFVVGLLWLSRGRIS